MRSNINDWYNACDKKAGDESIIFSTYSQATKYTGVNQELQFVIATKPFEYHE